MKFYGNGIIWDKENNKKLCKFVNGVFETNDKRIIDTLVKSGFEHDPYPEPTKKEIMTLLDQKGIEYSPRDTKADLLSLLEEGVVNESSKTD